MPKRCAFSFKRDVSMLPPNEILTPGRSACVYPIPTLPVLSTLPYKQINIYFFTKKKKKKKKKKEIKRNNTLIKASRSKKYLAPNSKLTEGLFVWLSQ